MVSVIVIGRNEGSALESCFTSVHEALAGMAYEVIYVDSHSTDASLALAKAHGARCFLPKTTDTTAALGRYIGTQEARGEHLLFLDGDMRLEKDFVQVALEMLAQTKCAGACGIRHDIYEVGGVVTGENENYFQCTTMRLAPEFGGALLIERAALERVKGWSPNVETCEEAELHARLMQQKMDIVELPVPMIVHTDRVQRARSMAQILFSRRRLGYGQALRQATRSKSLFSYIRREKIICTLYALDVICLLAMLLWGGGGVLFALFTQAAQLGFLGAIGRLRTFVGAKLQLIYFPTGVMSYHVRDLAYEEWTV